MLVPRKKWTVPQLTRAYGRVRVPRKKWTVPQLTRAYGRVRVPRNLDCTLLHWRSLLPRSKKVSTQNLLVSRWWDNHSGITVAHELQTQKNQILMKEYESRKCWSLVVQLCCSCRISLISHQLHLKSLCFSAPPCEGWLWLFLIRCSKLEKSSLKWQCPGQIRSIEQQNQSFLANWSNWALSSHYSLWMLNILSVHLSLGSNLPFGRPSASFENSIILSFCLTITTASLSVMSKTQHQNTFSLYAGATKEVNILSLAHKGIW